jgi:hypothetical protein
MNFKKVILLWIALVFQLNCVFCMSTAKDIEPLMRLFVATSKMLTTLEAVATEKTTKHETAFPNLFLQMGGCLKKLDYLGIKSPVRECEWEWVEDAKIMSEVTFYQDSSLTDDYFDQVNADKRMLSTVLESLRADIDKKLLKLKRVDDKAFDLVRESYQQAIQISGE